MQSINSKIDNLGSIIQGEFTKINTRLDNFKARLCQVEEGINTLDKRFIVVETTLKGVDKRLENVETRINSLTSPIFEKIGF